MNDEQRPRGSAAALEPAAPALESEALRGPARVSSPARHSRTRTRAATACPHPAPWPDARIHPPGLVGATVHRRDMGLFNPPPTRAARRPRRATPTPRNSSQPRPPRLYWDRQPLRTYRGRHPRQRHPRSHPLFVANIGGIAISQFCLLFTHDILGLLRRWPTTSLPTSSGFVLGTAFRFFLYHYVVHRTYA